MAKRKKPVSIFNLPKDEIKKASSEIIRKTSKEAPATPKKEAAPVVPPKPKASPPTKRKTTPKPKKKATPPPKTLSNAGKRKFLYVDEATHLQAKIIAATRGMKLQQYIAWLIINDSK